MLTEVNANVYDDQERCIGTWFGKPLYRKILFVISPAVASHKTVDISYLNIDTLASMKFTMYKNTHPADRGDVCIPTIENTTSQYTIGFILEYKRTTKSLEMQIGGNGDNIYGSSYANANVTVFLEYTKTTDN